MGIAVITVPLKSEGQHLEISQMLDIFNNQGKQMGGISLIWLFKENKCKAVASQH